MSDPLDRLEKALVSSDDTLFSIRKELLAVLRAVDGFYKNHEHLGWGGHEGMGKALDNLNAAIEREMGRE